MMMNMINGRDVYIVDGSRTPQLKARGKPGPFSASDLAVSAGRALLMRHNFNLGELNEVIIGCVMPSEDEANIGRVIALRLGIPQTVPAWTVQRNCASGMQSIDSAFHNIASGQSELILAGMWGTHRGNIGDMRKRIAEHVEGADRKLGNRITDQEFLRWKITSCNEPSRCC